MPRDELDSVRIIWRFAVGAGRRTRSHSNHVHLLGQRHGRCTLRWLYPREATAKSQVIMTLRKELMLIWVLLKNTGRNFFQDNGFFLAMGLAYNLLLYFIPLTLLMISVLGYTIFDSERAMTAVQSVVQQFLPESEQEFVQSLAAIVADRGLLGVIGFMLFIFFSSTLFGSVRHVLNIIFKAERGRGFIQGLGRDFPDDVIDGAPIRS